jgi:hypothetical protein
MLIAAFPRTVCAVPAGSRGVHESCLRSFQILEEVKRMLEAKVPADYIRRAIALMEGE